MPKQALTVGVGTIMDARQVLILITGQNKAYALRMAVEEGISHMWTVSALQQHPKVIITWQILYYIDSLLVPLYGHTDTKLGCRLRVVRDINFFSISHSWVLILEPRAFCILN